MRLREVYIKNFRCLKEVRVPIDDYTVLIGENNTGKTTFLDAIRKVIKRGYRRGSPFDEYDYHMCTASDTPASSEGITIELLFKEDHVDQWPAEIKQALDPIVNIALSGEYSVKLRVFSHYGSDASWEFLNTNDETISDNPRFINTFLEYVVIFYLSALRDSSDEFSSRSQYWGKILKSLEIPEERLQEIQDKVKELNDDMLHADTRMTQVTDALDNMQKLVSLGKGHAVGIQALPLKPWELMAKSEIVISGRGGDAAFPISSHGQGTQSLAVLFLFQAYIDILLRPMFHQETESILALEEPEAHLHPQAARALTQSLGSLPSQKVVTTHSPYFIQNVPISSLRYFRRESTEVEVFSVKRSYSMSLPNIATLQTFCANNPKYSYSQLDEILKLTGTMTEQEFRALATLFPRTAERNFPLELRQLQRETLTYLSDGDLSSLDTYVKRVRGEILFSKAWLLCEGQSEYILLHYFADLMQLSFDSNGVSVIDFQNNGNPKIFVALAESLGIPWIFICDDDTAAPDFLDQLHSIGIDHEVKHNLLVRKLPNGQDLEACLVNNGFEVECAQILIDLGEQLANGPQDEGYRAELADKLRNHKQEHARRLVEMLQNIGAGVERIPGPFKNIIALIVGRANA